MFGQRDHKDENIGAPAVPPAGRLNTSTGIPDDHAVTQMLADSGAPSLAGPAPAAPAAYVPFSGEAMTASAPVATPAPVTAAPYQAAPPTQSMPVSSPSPSNMLDMSTDDLVRMKQEALQHLQPLVGTLQQSPEEEFRTLMMMIQATDDRTMLKKALEAAKSIQDDKIRAQAMLDVINEINYFTQTSGE